MKLFIVEIFKTLQGEGSRTGQPALFVRFQSCNLWDGFDKNRTKGKGVCSKWCDTFFAKGKSYSKDDLIKTIKELTQNFEAPLIVLTGGEPMLQLKKAHGYDFVKSLLDDDFEVAIETNGTVNAPVIQLLSEHPNGHITVSPKPLKGKLNDTLHVKVKAGNDLKVIYPTEFNLKDLRKWNLNHFYLPPKDEGAKNNVFETIEQATKEGWKVSIQTHKLLGLP